jgi:DNA polymerase I-like protein with 3'-5' exonuclease and polymerase domains
MNTQSHDFFYQRHGEKLNINCIIPLTKHYEKCENIFDKIKEYCVISKNLKFHNKLTNVFFFIEQNGIKIDKEAFDTYFNVNDTSFSIYENTIYTQYNLHNTTGRPSNRFNGINFAALNKEDGCRKI